VIAAPIRYAIDTFVRKGWTVAQAAGIASNLIAESGLRSNVVGDSGLAYGIAQWHPPRQRNFLAVYGKDIRDSSLDEQLDFVHVELTTTEAEAGNALRACKTPAEAGSVVSQKYERPADREGEAAKRARMAESIYRDYVGVEQEPAPIEEPHPQPQPQPEGKRMDPLSLIGIFGSVLTQLIPQVGKLFGGQKDAQNAQVIGTVLDTIVKATGQTGATDVATVGSAIQAMQASPDVRKAVTQAVVTNPEIIGLLEVGGGIKAARAANLAIQTSEKPFWYNPAFWVTLMLLPLVYWIVGSVLVGGIEIDKDSWWQVLKIFGKEFNAETRSGTVNLVIGMVLGGIVGIWFGTSYGSMRKTELAAEASAAELAKRGG